MQHFQLILIVIGVLAIVAVLVHGYFVNRKEKRPATDNLSDSEGLISAKTDTDCQDAILGDVRIIRTDSEDEDEDCDFATPSEIDDVEEISFAAEFSEQETDSEDFTDSFALDNEAPAVEEVETIAEPEQQPAPEKQDHFVFNVAAKEGKTVRGSELLPFFLTSGFRFGEMSIFHRHLHSDGTGPVLFSIANMMKPGVFDPENMEQFNSEGGNIFLNGP